MNKKEFPRGVRPLDIFISSIQKDRTTTHVDGRAGFITTGHTHQTRPIELTLKLEADNTRDYRLLRNEVFSFFDDDYLYISELYEPTKRYKVAITQSYIPDRFNQALSQVSIMVDMVDLPYAESIGTTQGELSDSLLWWPYRDYPDVKLDELQYTFTENSFRVYNGGNVPIHPFQQDLVITIEDIYRSFEYFELVNQTNGTTFRINENAQDKQVVLDGASVTANGLQYLRKTNKQFIELEPGWNDFTTSGAFDRKVSFDFRFYYK